MKKYKFNHLHKNVKKISGFTFVELIISLSIISILSVIAIPSFLNWLRVERINSYTREVQAYFRIVRLEARRWGASCFVEINPISYEAIARGKDSEAYSVVCKYSIDPNSSKVSQSKIGTIVPRINNSIFQVINKNFQITPNGRISSEKSIVIVIGSRYHRNGPKLLNCLVIKTPTGHIMKGKFSQNDWITSEMAISQISENNILNTINCKLD